MRPDGVFTASAGGSLSGSGGSICAPRSLGLALPEPEPCPAPNVDCEPFADVDVVEGSLELHATAAIARGTNRESPRIAGPNIRHCPRLRQSTTSLAQPRAGDHLGIG